MPRYGYLVGVDVPGDWTEVANSDAREYGGSGVGNRGRAVALAVPAHGRPHSIALTLPPLGAVFLKPPPAAAASSSRRRRPLVDADAETESALAED